MIPLHYTDRIIAPSLLASDFSCIEVEVSRAIYSKADWLHLDVMDGHFVDNISFGPDIISAIHSTNDIFLDVHLMISRPDHYLSRFVAAGADLISVHIEAEHDMKSTLKRIREAGCLAGIALNPETSFEAILPYLKSIDLLLVMTVIPGFGGQSFIPNTLEKVRLGKTYREKHNLKYHIQVDGGLTKSTASPSYEAGANVIVAGSSTFKATDMQHAISEIRLA